MADTQVTLRTMTEDDVADWVRWLNDSEVTEFTAMEEEHAIAFSGNFEYDPNADAVKYFARHIWPSLRNRWPKLVWRLIGRGPEFVSRYLGVDGRIQPVGAPEDAVRSLAAVQAAVVQPAQLAQDILRIGQIGGGQALSIEEGHPLQFGYLCVAGHTTASFRSSRAPAQRLRRVRRRSNPRTESCQSESVCQPYRPFVHRSQHTGLRI